MYSMKHASVMIRGRCQELRDLALMSGELELRDEARAIEILRELKTIVKSVRGNKFAGCSLHITLMMEYVVMRDWDRIPSCVANIYLNMLRGYE